MHSRTSRFLVRWVVSSLGIWIAAELLGKDNISYGGRISVVIISGLVLAAVNTVIRPIIVFLTLPAVLLTLGIFMLFINGFMVVVVAWLYEPLEVSGFGIAIVTGIVIGLVNWLVSALLEEKK